MASMACGTTWFGSFAFVSIVARAWVDTRSVGMLSSAPMLSAITWPRHLILWDSPPTCIYHNTSSLLWLACITVPHHMSNWPSSHACASWSSFRGSNTKCPWTVVECLLTALVILPIRRDSNESDDMESFSRSCRWVSYTDSYASRLDIIVTMNMFSGDYVERRFEIIIFSLIFYHIQRDFCVINDNEKGLETRC